MFFSSFFTLFPNPGHIGNGKIMVPAQCSNSLSKPELLLKHYKFSVQAAILPLAVYVCMRVHVCTKLCLPPLQWSHHPLLSAQLTLPAPDLCMWSLVKTKLLETGLYNWLLGLWTKVVRSKTTNCVSAVQSFSTDTGAGKPREEGGLSLPATVIAPKFSWAEPHA